ncbi:MAG: YkgJ family cysteine cluster protein [Saprospiraceae bacterium]
MAFDLDSWNQIKNERSQNLNVTLELLSLKKTEEIIPVLHKTHADVFNNNIQCLDCANCCKNAPPIITNADINRISKVLKMTKKNFIRSYVIEDINGDLFFKSVPCLFLNSNNACQIYSDRPAACRQYPHTDEPEFHKRLALNKKIVSNCPAAFYIIESISNQLNHDI